MDKIELERAVDRVLSNIGVPRQSRLGDVLIPGIRGGFNLLGRSEEDITKSCKIVKDRYGLQGPPLGSK